MQSLAVEGSELELGPAVLGAGGAEAGPGREGAEG